MRIRTCLGLVAMLGLTGAAPNHGPNHAAEREVERARALAGTEFAGSLFLCEERGTRIADMLAKGPRWLAPTRAFDNLWYIGNSFVGTWLLRTSEGLILIDASQSEEDVREHLLPAIRSLGFQPADIRYIIVTHGHWDHYGGAKYLQERYGARVAMSKADWDLLERSPPGSLVRAPHFGEDRADRPPPRRDVVVSDGQKLKLGDTEITLLVTPGHSPGTLSALIPVKEGERTHVLSLLGGTAFPPQREPNAQTGGLLAFDRSVKRLSDASRKAGAAGLVNTHIFVDGTDQRLARSQVLQRGMPNPFIIGTDRVVRYYAMFRACLKAAQLRPAGRGWSADDPPRPSSVDVHDGH